MIQVWYHSFPSSFDSSPLHVLFSPLHLSLSALWTLLHLAQLLDIPSSVRSLESTGRLEVDVSLPGRSTDAFDSVGVGEDSLNLLEGLARRLREEEEDVEEHGDTEDTEDDVRPPLNIDERWRDEVGESEVEGPVGGGSESDGFATHAEWVQLRWVDPGDWTLCWGV